MSIFKHGLSAICAIVLYGYLCEINIYSENRTWRPWITMGELLHRSICCLPLLSTRSRHVTTRSVQTAWRSWQRRSGQSRVPPVDRSTTYIWFSTRKICECDCKPTEGSDHERASWMHSDPEWRHQTPQGQNVSCVKASQLHSGANDCGGVKIASMSACVATCVIFFHGNVI